MAVENMMVMRSASPSPSGETLPEKVADTMMPTPTITAAMAAQVARFTRSLNKTQASRAANSGAAACVSRMLATVVYCSATTKAEEATPKHTATASPGSPMLRNSFAVPDGPSRHIMKSKRKEEAKSERQNTLVQLSSTVMKRAMVPPKLQHSAAPATSSKPKRKSAAGERAGIAWVEVMTV